MRPFRRLALTGGLVLALLLVGAPFHAVVAVEAAPEVVTADLDVGATELQDTAGGRRTDVVEAPIAFTGLWVELDVPVEEIHVRTSPDGQGWSDWSALETLDEEDGPDPGSAEDRAAAGHVDIARTSELMLVGESRYVQLEVPEEVGAVKVRFADASGVNDSVWVRLTRWLSRTPQPAEASTSVPSWVVTRNQWGAREPTESPRTASSGVRLVVVHHTASMADYTPDAVANQLRIIQSFHMNTRGWSDIGYNALVDRFGRVYEGRKGGLDRAVIGAHATNFNTGSFGVAVLGNFTNARAPQAAIDGLSDIIGYKSMRHGFDPAGTVTFNGQSRPVVVGHRDVGQTACPGRIQEQLPEIRGSARLNATAFGPFSDIGVNSTHGHAVLRLYQHDIVNGCGFLQFCPADKLTRAQAASLLARALDLQPGDGSVFSDVKRGSTHEANIGAAVARGIVTGYDDGRFGPTDPITREQMASMLARTMQLTPANGSRFSDVSVRSTHGRNVYAIYDAGITQGCGGDRFCPRDHVTRAQMASFVDALRERLGMYDEEIDEDAEGGG